MATETPRRLALDEWKSKFAQAANGDGAVLLMKGYTATVKALDECPGGAECPHDGAHATAVREIDFTITTADVDREHDTVAAEGWQVDNYLRNPVVLWAHDYRTLPIGRAKTLGRTAIGLSARAEFTPRELNPFGDTVYRMTRAGYLNATSVGFNPMKWAYNETRRGVDFSEAELLEFSVVPVPANPLALVEARSKGIDTAPILAWAEKVLDEWTEGSRGVWVPKGKIEQAFTLLSIPRSYSLPAVTVAADATEELTFKAPNPFGGETTITVKVAPASVPTEQPTPVLRIHVPDPQAATPEFVTNTLRDVVNQTVAAEMRTALTAVTGRID